MPTKDRAHSAIHVEYDEKDQHSFLFDCGENTQRQLLRAGLNLMKIDNIFITHWHGDHCLGLPGLVDTMGFESRKTPLQIFAPEGRRIGKCINFSHSLGKFKVQPKFVPFKGKHINKVFTEDRFYVESIPVEHGVPTVAYAIVEKDKESIDMDKAREVGLPEEGVVYKELKEKGKVVCNGKKISLKDLVILEKGKRVVYSGDTLVCDNLRKIARGADLLIQDCTYFGVDERHAYKHASLPEIVKMAKEENIKKVILTHISRRFTDISKLREMVKDYPNMEVAEDFMKVVV